MAAQNSGATDALKGRVAAAQGAPPVDDAAAVMAAAVKGQQSDYDAPRRPQGRNQQRGTQGQRSAKRGPTKAEQDELQVTEVAAALRAEEQRFLAERREELRRASRRGEAPPPRQNRVLSLITQAPDASDPFYADGTPVEKEAGYVYRWVRREGDGGKETKTRIRSFQQYRYEMVNNPDGEPVVSEFGVLMRARVVDAGTRMLSRMKSGVLRRRDTLETSYELAEQINREAGHEVIRVREDPRYNRREREMVSADYEPNDLGADE